MRCVQALVYEKAGPEDIVPIFRLCKDLIDRYEDPEKIPYDKVLAWVRGKITDNIGEYTVVKCGGQKAGYFRFHPEGSAMELDDLYVLDAFRNRGIGTQVVEKCCQETALPVFLYVFRKNTGAVKLYQRLGFEISETVNGSRYIMVKNSL